MEPEDFVAYETEFKKRKITAVESEEDDNDEHLEKGLESTRRCEENTELSLTKFGMLNKSYISTIRPLLLRIIIY